MRTIALIAGGLLAPGTAWARPDLYNNGPFVTGPAPSGDDLSLVQSNTVPLVAFGFSCALFPDNFRLADDFTVTDPAGWTISSVVFAAFQTGSGTAASTFTALNLRLWSGRPGDPGSVILYGDTTTNILSSAAWTGCYRANEANPGGTTRPIFHVEGAIDPPLHLSPGTYWLDWQASGTRASGPWSVPVTILGQPAAPNSNGRVYISASSQWINLRDSGAQQDLAFIIRGAAGSASACVANCDGSTTQPILNVADFTCFLNRFAAGDSRANCDGSTAPPVLNVADFTCFLNRFAAGCSAP